ncbi:MAG: efflux RND transporter periplasmic adaptor subunit [Xanthomonadaceae bacterium]|nr:efflux RND transporter periplasmic adaptor subunit [Xanthomonadaceae bacterium]MDE1884632.1 efflux RND transporter periplasmic adaptor subunit [Xanthomonadaceae bacterium]MDE1960511.1 efflux RND transporter periplasmic adaptor subunit [Xanthomonadaceae bacterium]MDE2083528.1 efflux RND transporter periplasmic adaptor subunit [Xanthomonadaceae bacterium]MDE2258532.1 efflux RND transporter periplasmic adaptor subunit [Xanthomonadaceae bacterium]
MRFRISPAPVLIFALGAAGCGKAPSQQMQMPPPQVGVVTVKAQAVPLTRDLVGRLYPTRSADVRARVAGVLQKRVYTEGTDVKQGQLLFQIDPAPFKAALDAQLANLAAAKATNTNNHVAAERARSIADKGLLSKTDLDNALAAERTAAAAVQQAQANVEAARINLGYASVTAPIAGRAGQQQVTEGALVGQGTATLLTRVEQIDPIYVYFSQAVDELDALRREQADGHVALEGTDKAKVEIVLPNGRAYAHAGTLDFSDTQVDAATGAVELRGILPNPDHQLLPGMYVNVRVTLGQIKHAFLIPQIALLRDPAGAYVFVVGADGKTAAKHVVTDGEQGADFVVTSGLADGDQVIVSGVQFVHPGAPAKAVPWKPAQTTTPASKAH